MSMCHVSGRPAGVGHVPVARVRLACRCGPCPSTARRDWSALPNKAASLMRHFLRLLFADCLRGADQLRRSAPGHILTIRLHFCTDFNSAIKQYTIPTKNNRAVEESQSTLQCRPWYTARTSHPSDAALSVHRSFLHLLRQVDRPFHSEFSRKCALVFPLSSS
jgi:hypothetical protein